MDDTKPISEAADSTEWEASAKKTFLSMLEHLVRDAGLAERAFAKKTELTRQQLHDLRTSTRLPSRIVLARVCETLRETAVKSQVPELMARGLGLVHIGDHIWHVVNENMTSFREREYREIPGLESRCILSDAIGEATDENLLDITLKQMRNHGTEYFYFLPDTFPSRRLFFDLVRKCSREDLARAEKLTYFIRSPEPLFVARVRFENIERPDYAAHYSLGSPRAPIVFAMQASEAERVRRTILPVVSDARLARREKRRHIEIGTDAWHFNFELDG